MERRAINPWSWQDNFGFVQANEITGAQKVLFCSGQTSVDENGTPVHEGDMASQAVQALDNLEAVLKDAGM
ncbi:MAG: RidA family protein, partial [Chloroflexi bacterium]|nr:RidA family protein [Chloroflexota bacterium]